jgi:hypothetical protein
MEAATVEAATVATVASRKAAAATTRAAMTRAAMTTATRTLGKSSARHEHGHRHSRQQNHHCFTHRPILQRAVTMTSLFIAIVPVV